MENDSFIDDFPSHKPPFSSWIFHGYVSHNQMTKTHVQIEVTLGIAEGSAPPEYALPPGLKWMMMSAVHKGLGETVNYDQRAARANMI